MKAKLMAIGLLAAGVAQAGMELRPERDWPYYRSGVPDCANYLQLAPVMTALARASVDEPADIAVDFFLGTLSSPGSHARLVEEWQQAFVDTAEWVRVVGIIRSPRGGIQRVIFGVRVTSQEQARKFWERLWGNVGLTAKVYRLASWQHVEIVSEDTEPQQARFGLPVLPTGAE